MAAHLVSRMDSGLGISVIPVPLPMLPLGENVVLCPFYVSLSKSLAEFSFIPCPWLLAVQSWSGGRPS